jgi:hypothetical protein
VLANAEQRQELVAMVAADLSQRLRVAIAQVELARFEPVVWPDGSIGCPEPGGAYLQAPVDGYQIVLRVGETAYDYHVGKNDHFVLCHRPMPASPGGSLDR